MVSDPSGREVVPYGSWRTPVTSAAVVESAVGLSDVQVDGTDVVWAERRPDEGGRTQLVRRTADGARIDLLTDGQNARTAVHEYGGGAWWVHDGIVWFASWDDQRLYRLDLAAGSAVPLTPVPEAPRGDRYADGDLSPDGRWIACVREHHPTDGRGAVDVRNELVRLAAHEESVPEVLVTGPDFVANPRWSPAGDRLCWIEWNHPDMPWDATWLVVRDLVGGDDTVVAGGAAEACQDASWQPDGSLVFISDRTGWWNLYRWSPDDGTVEPLVEIAADIGEPPWGLGGSRYTVLTDGRIVFARWRDGIDGLAVRLLDGTISELDLGFTSIFCVGAASGASVVVTAGTPTAEPSISRVVLGPSAEIASVVTLRPARDLADLGIDPAYLSTPEPVAFPSARGRTAYGLLYAPANPVCVAPEGEKPPLLTLIHGGPTAMADPVLRVPLQYWTTRGFAVIDVNYAGSTGYGRAYRNALRGEWGVADVEDCIAAARWLAEQDRVDPARLCIRGGSAGGYTTLAALARTDTPFAAGADLFGLADLEAIARETHKFESRYLDSLVAPYPEGREVYRERSPIHHVDAFTRPLIVLQGAEDPVVPPNQSEMIVEALRAKGVPVGYLLFEGEQHGFRRAENIRRALDAELSFYAQVFGFELPAAEEIEPVRIENL
ncbi:MAG TPA: S9 family peptidase [Solirubrobacteraceae bacterium]|nr:S9 family peptidase [Solirubrobacteraceae bacterium]